MTQETRKSALLRPACDRIAVIYEGRIMKVLNAAETDKQELGLLMAGIGAAEKSPADGEAEE